MGDVHGRVVESANGIAPLLLHAQASKPLIGISEIGWLHVQQGFKPVWMNLVTSGQVLVACTSMQACRTGLVKKLCKSQG